MVTSEPKTVVVATRIYEPEPAAASFRLSTMVDGLLEHGYRVVVLTSSFEDAPRREERGNLVIKRAPVLRGKDGYMRGYSHYMSFDIPLFFRLLTERVWDVVINEPPPTTGFVTTVAAKLRRKPHLYFAADIWSDALHGTDTPGFVTSAVTRLEATVLKSANRILSVSAGVDKRVAALSQKICDRIPFSMDSTVFCPRHERPKGAPGGPYFLYAGTASERHGASVFIDALKIVHESHPEAELVYIGSGSDWESMKKTASSDPRIHFLDRQDPSVIASWMSSATASVASLLPGEGYDYAYPTKLLASFSCGTPVVFSGVGPARDHIEQAEQLGIAVDHDPGQVAQAMCQILESRYEPGPIIEWADENCSTQAAHRAIATVIKKVLNKKT